MVFRKFLVFYFFESFFPFNFFNSINNVLMKVYAIDIIDNFVSFMGQRVHHEKLKNVVVSKCRDKHADLKDGVADGAFICDVYHHFLYPKTFMRSLHRALKADGIVVVVDYYRDPKKMVTRPPQWALDHIRADRTTFQKEIEEAGFELIAMPDLADLQENYCMVFKKRD